MTYEKRIEELNKELEKEEPKTGYQEETEYYVILKACKEQLNELRDEAIAKVKELNKENQECEKEMIEKWGEKRGKDFCDNYCSGCEKNRIIIDYLKAEWNIKEEEI